MKTTPLLLSVVAALIMACVPPEPEVEPEPALSKEEMERRRLQCEIALSNAWEYYKNREYTASIRNYHTVLDLGCAEEFASNVYLYFGRAYIELENLDSANWAFKQGLKYLSGDKNLLTNIAYVSGRQGRKDDQIYYLERLVEIDSVNVEAYSTLNDLYNSEARYDDQIRLLQNWIQFDPQNSRLQSDLIAVYEKSGRDPLDHLKQRWEENPENSQWGLEYAQRLINNFEHQRASRVLEDIIRRSPTTRRAYELLTDVYVRAGEIDKAIKVMEDLFRLDKTDYKIPLELSRTYLQIGSYSQSLEWAETAIRLSNDAGEAYSARAEVYYKAAEECLKSRANGLAVFDDKLVYKMAHEDYSTALSKGVTRVKKRLDFLEENLIPTKGDWFMQPAGERVFAPQGNCYTWINRNIRRP